MKGPRRVPLGPRRWKPGRPRPWAKVQPPSRGLSFAGEKPGQGLAGCPAPTTKNIACCQWSVQVKGGCLPSAVTCL